MIYKEVLRLVDVQAIEVQPGAELLCAREQHDQICVWYRFGPVPREKWSTERRELAIVATGNDAADHGRFLGTCLLRGGALVFHVFER